MADKRYSIGEKPSITNVLSTVENLDKWVEQALRKNALSMPDKRIIEELVCYYKRKELAKYAWVERALTMANSYEASYLIQEELNRMFNEGKFEEVDEIISGLVVENLDTFRLVSFLTATKWAEDKLKTRKEFYKRIESHFLRLGILERGLLSGLA